MIPIGATVDITNHGGRWRGVVTGRPGPYSIEIDGWLTAPANLAKVVGEMGNAEISASAASKYLKADVRNYENLIASYDYAISEAVKTAVAERDALRELVVAQATTNAELAQEAERIRESWTRAAARAEEYANEIERLEEFEQIAKDAATYVEDLLLLFMGERRPVRPIQPPELRRLAEFVFEGV